MEFKTTIGEFEKEVKRLQLHPKQKIAVHFEAEPKKIT